MRFPFTALVRRDLLRTLRGFKTFLWVLLLVGLSCFYLGGRWPDEGVLVLQGSWFAESIVETSIYFWLWAAVSLMPIYGAASIVRERERDTYDALSLTLISPLGHVLGRIINTLGLFGLLLLSSLSVYAAVFFLVGVDLETILLGALVILATAFSSAAIGTLSSVLFKRLVPAIFCALLSTGLVMGGPVAVAVFAHDILRWRWISNVFPESVLLAVCPFAAPHLLRLGEVMWCLLAVGLQILVGLAFIAISLWVLRRQARLQDKASRSLLHRLWAWLFAPDIVPFPPLPDESNVLFEREVRWLGLSRRPLRDAIVSVVIFLCLLGAFSLSQEAEGNAEAVITWTGMCFAIIGLLCPFLCATKLAHELRPRRLDDIRMTLVDPGSMLLAKLRAAGSTILPVVVACIVCFPLIIDWVGSTFAEWTIIITGTGSLLVGAWVAMGVSLLASTFCKGTPQALILAYLTTGLLFFLLVMVAAMGYSLAQDVLPALTPRASHPLMQFLKHTVIFVMPTAAFAENLTRLARSKGAHLLSVYWVANVTFCFLYGWGFVRVAQWRLQRIWVAQP